MRISFILLGCLLLISPVQRARSSECEGARALIQTKGKSGGATKYGWPDFGAGPLNGIYKKRVTTVSDTFHYHQDHETPDGTKTTDYTETQNTTTTDTATAPNPYYSCMPYEPLHDTVCSGDLSVDNSGNCGGPKTCSNTYQEDCTWSSTDCRFSDLSLLPGADECDNDSSTTATSVHEESHCSWYTDFDAQYDHESTITLSDPFSDSELLSEIAQNLKSAAWPSDWADSPTAEAGLSFSPGAYCGSASSTKYRFKIPETKKGSSYKLEWLEITKYADGKREAQSKSEVVTGNGDVQYGKEHTLNAPSSPGAIVSVQAVKVSVTSKDDSGNSDGSSGSPGTGGPDGSAGGNNGSSVSLNASGEAKFIASIPAFKEKHEGYGDGSGGYGVAVSTSPENGCRSCGGANSRGISESGFNFMIYTGTRAGGYSAGAFQLSMANPETFTPTPGVAPYILDYTVLAPDVELIMAGDDIRQVKAPQTLANVVVLNDHKFKIDFYAPNQVGPKVNDVYTLQSGAQPFVTWTIENTTSAEVAHVVLTKTIGQQNTVWTYDYSQTDHGWTVLYPGNLRRERTVSQTTDGLRVVTFSVDSPSGPEVYRAVRTYKLIEPTPGETHELLIEEKVGPTSNPQITSYTYDETLSFEGSAAPLTQVIYPDGSWNRYVIANDGTARILEKFSAFQNQGPTSDPSLCRHTVYTYDSSIEPYTATSVVEYLLGHVIAKRTVTISAVEKVEIQHHSPDSATDDELNLRTVTTYYPDSDPSERRVKSIKYADGTMTLYEYTLDGNGFESITTESTGEPDVTETAILDGTSTVTEYNSAGQLVSKVVRHIPSNIILSSATYSNFDEFMRPQRVTFLDGTHEDRVYACCGLETFTDRDGLVTQYGYDAMHRETTAVASGITTTKVLDAAGQVKQVTRTGTDNTQVTLHKASYDLAGRQVSAENGLNGVTYFNEVLNGGNQLVKTTTFPNLGTVIETYNRDGTLQQQGGTAASPVRYQYGLITDTASPEYGATWVEQIRLNANGTDSQERVKTFTDHLRHVYKKTYTDGSESRMYYNNKGQLCKQVDQDGVVTLLQYNGKGTVEYAAIDMDRDGVIDFDGTDRVSRTVTDVVVSHGVNVRRARTYIWTTDNVDQSVLDSTTEVSTDGLRQWATQGGLESETLTVYGANGVTTVTSWHPDRAYSVNTFNKGRLESTVVYDSQNVQIKAVTFGYDAHGRQSIVTDARNGATTLTFNTADLEATRTEPAAGVGQTPRVTKTFYNSMLEVSKIEFPDGSQLFKEYELNGQPKKTYGSQTYPVEYSYDVHGRKKTMKTWQSFSTLQGASVTTWSYDPNRGFVSSKSYENGKTTSYTYTGSGKLLTRQTARGHITTYGYNAAGDLESIDYSDSTPDITYSFDRRGRNTTILQNGSTYTVTLNDVGQAVSETYSGGTLNGVSVTSAYDSLFRRLSVTTAGIMTTFGYDDASRIKSVTKGDDSAWYQYHQNSSLINTVTFKKSGSVKQTTTRSYDFNEELTGISTVAPNATVLSSVAYLYNAAGQRQKATRQDGTYWSFQYDSMGQTKSAKKFWANDTPVSGEQFEYDFDDIGNRKTAKFGGDSNGQNLRVATYGVNSVNQYTDRTVPGLVNILGTANASGTVTINNVRPYRHDTFYQHELNVDNAGAAVFKDISVVGVLNNGSNPDIVTTKTGTFFVPKTPETFVYDDDGNLTADGRWTYTWDAESRLTTMESGAFVPESKKQKLVFEYDFKGRRVRKQVYTRQNNNWQLSSDRKFVYDDWVLLAELDQNNAVVRSYIWGIDLSGSLQGGGGIGGLLGVTVHQPSATTYFVTPDGGGNVSCLVNGDNSTVAAEYEYGVFGEPIRVDGIAATANPFRFSTKYCDDETGLLYYGYRYYNPSTGRWISRDPLEETGSVNLYAAMSNDPVGIVDALGLYDCQAERWNYDIAIPKTLAKVFGEKLEFKFQVRAEKKFCKKCCPTYHPTDGVPYGMDETLSLQIRGTIEAKWPIPLPAFAQPFVTLYFRFQGAGAGQAYEKYLACEGKWQGGGAIKFSGIIGLELVNSKALKWLVDVSVRGEGQVSATREYHCGKAGGGCGWDKWKTGGAGRFSFHIKVLGDRALQYDNVWTWKIWESGGDGGGLD